MLTIDDDIFVKSSDEPFAHAPRIGFISIFVFENLSALVFGRRK